MPKRIRIGSQTGIYHGILRSVNQQIIFEDNQDYFSFLTTLKESLDKYDVTLYGYCLMNNHVHLLLKAGTRSNLSDFFQFLESRFVYWYNKKYDRFGCLFQCRFNSYPVESDQKFLKTLFYIHNNPVAAGMCRFQSDYPWSSQPAYYGKKNTLVETKSAIGIAGNIKMLHIFFSHQSMETTGKCDSDEYECPSIERPLTDEMALKIFHDLTNHMSISDVQHICKYERNVLIQKLRQQKLSYKQLSRLFGVSNSTIVRALNQKMNNVL